MPVSQLVVSVIIPISPGASEVVEALSMPNLAKAPIILAFSMVNSERLGVYA